MTDYNCSEIFMELLNDFHTSFYQVLTYMMSYDANPCAFQQIHERPCNIYETNRRVKCIDFYRNWPWFGIRSHGSWHLTVVNFHSNKILQFRIIELCNLHHFKQKYPAHVSMSPALSWHSLYQKAPCMCDDVTMLNKWKRGTPTSNTNANKNFQINICNKFESINSIIPPLCMSRKLSEVVIFNLWSETWQLNQGNPHGDRGAIFIYPWIVLLQYMAFQQWLQAIKLSNWWRMESPKYAQLHCGRMNNSKGPVMDICFSELDHQWFNTLRLRQNGRHFQMHFLQWKCINFN